MKRLICAIGDLTLDTILPGISSMPDWGQETEIEVPIVRLGGNIGNMAIGAGALKTDFYVSSFVGDDQEGEFILRKLNSLNLDTTGVIKTSEKDTSKTYACVRTDGERFFLTYKGTLDLIGELVRNSNVSDSDIVFLGGWLLPPRVDVGITLNEIKKWHSLGKTVSTDLIWSDETWENKTTLIELLKAIDIVFMNEMELCCLTEESGFDAAAKKVQQILFADDSSTKYCIVKRGPDGASLLSKTETIHVPAYPAKPVDTVGAGDLFDIAFLHARFQLKMNEKQALKFASTFASISISRYNSSLPEEKEILELMKDR